MAPGPRRLLEHQRARRAGVAREQPERDDRPEAVADQQVDRAIEPRRDAVDERVEVQRAVAAGVAPVAGKVDRRHAPPLPASAGPMRHHVSASAITPCRSATSPRAWPSGSQRSVTRGARR